MNKKRLLGIILIIIGIIILLFRPLVGLTGFAVADQFEVIKNIWFYVVGVILVAGGIVLTAKKEGVPIPKGLEDIVEVAGVAAFLGPGGDLKKARGVYRQSHHQTPIVILDTNPILTLSEMGVEDLLKTDKFSIYMVDGVDKELYGLTKEQQTKGREKSANRSVRNYIMGLKERNPHFHQIRNPKRTSADEKYLEQKWDSFARSDEGRRATKYKDFRSDLLGVADGDIAMLAKKAQEQGQAVFAFTDDAALQGVLGEISRDGVKQGKPPIIAGGLTDWRNYALKYFGRDYSEQAA